MKLIYHSGRVHRKFVPTGKILRPVLSECATPFTLYWSLALLLRDKYGLMLVFKVDVACFKQVLKRTLWRQWSERAYFAELESTS